MGRSYALRDHNGEATQSDCVQSSATERWLSIQSFVRFAADAALAAATLTPAEAQRRHAETRDGNRAAGPSPFGCCAEAQAMRSPRVVSAAAWNFSVTAAQRFPSRRSDRAASDAGAVARRSASRARTRRSTSLGLCVGPPPSLQRSEAIWPAWTASHTPALAAWKEDRLVMVRIAANIWGLSGRRRRRKRSVTLQPRSRHRWAAADKSSRQRGPGLGVSE
jgi:hypothetical protein